MNLQYRPYTVFTAVALAAAVFALALPLWAIPIALFAISSLHAMLPNLLALVPGLSVKLASPRRRKTRPWAMVVGAGGGLGTELAERLADAGWNLYLTGISADEMREVDRRARAKGAETRLHSQAVSERTDAAALAAEANKLASFMEETDTELVWINAGATTNVPLETRGDVLQEECVAFMVTAGAAVADAHAAAAWLAKRGGGKLVLTSSIVDSLPTPGMESYSAAKAAVTSWAAAAGVTLAEKGVHVTTVRPAPLLTKFWKPMRGSDVGKMATAPLLGNQTATTAADIAVAGVGLGASVVHSSYLTWLARLAAAAGPRAAAQLTQTWMAVSNKLTA